MHTSISSRKYAATGAQPPGAGVRCRRPLPLWPSRAPEAVPRPSRGLPGLGRRSQAAGTVRDRRAHLRHRSPRLGQVPLLPRPRHGRIGFSTSRHLPPCGSSLDPSSSMRSGPGGGGDVARNARARTGAAAPLGQSRLDPEAQLPQFGFEYFPAVLPRLSGPSAWRYPARGWTPTVGRWRLVEKPIRAIGWSRQKRYFSHPCERCRSVLADLAGAGRLRLAGPLSAVLETSEDRREFGPGREVQGVDAGRQLPDPMTRKLHICD